MKPDEHEQLIDESLERERRDRESLAWMKFEREASARSDHYKSMKKIEDEHFGRCLWQQICEGRMMLVELFVFPAANTTAVVVRHYEKAIPRSGSGKPWPDQIASYVYLPVDDSNTWDGLNIALCKKAGQESKT